MNSPKKRADATNTNTTRTALVLLLVAGIALLSAGCADTTNTTATTDTSELGSIKNVSTTQTTSTTFTVQYTLPTLSEIMQAARDSDATNPVYTRSHVSILYREINPNRDTASSYEISNDVGYLVASDNEQARLHTVRRNRTNTLYHYVVSVVHHFEVNNYHSKPIEVTEVQYHEARTLAGTVPAIIKNINIQETTSTTFTVQYTLPTLSEITQEARDDGATNPVYTKSHVYIEYREATDTEPIPHPNIFESEYKRSNTISKNTNASNNEQTRSYTVAELKPNTRYFYALRIYHRFEKNHPHYSDFSAFDERIYETRTLP